jgi:antitoxin MazE
MIEVFSLQIVVRKFGKAAGVVIPKSILRKAGIALGDLVDLNFSRSRIIITAPERCVRSGWAEASAAIAAAGDDALIWPDFGNTEEQDR